MLITVTLLTPEARLKVSLHERQWDYCLIISSDESALILISCELLKSNIPSSIVRLYLKLGFFERY
jgi:hypothetical protein